MTTVAVQPPARSALAQPGRRLALAGILALAAFLHFFRLEQEGFGNLYYAAAVESMRQSWHNFFFVSFDPGGFVSVDKPPLGLWAQVWSAQLFGFTGWSLHLPQALAGVLSVGLLYGLVRRVFGPTAGLLAALVLTLTPISVAANRNNTMDSLLVLTSLWAAGAASLAAERGQLRWLLVCALLVGAGFNIKMLQAMLIAPAVFGVYLLTAPIGRLKRLAHLALAGGLLAVVSLAWPLAVEATPPDARPYIGSSQNNSVLELIIGHNGLARLGSMASLLGRPAGPGRPGPANPPPAGPGRRPPAGSPLPSPPAGAPPQAGPGLQNETGPAGPLRLFNPQLAGQASWFLPLAVACAATLAWQAGRRLDQRHRAALLWALWLIPQIVFFSYAGLFHRYYLEMLSPAIAALTGAGLAGLWRDYQAGGPRGWLLPALLAGTLAVEAVVILASDTAGWAAWLIPTAGALTLSGVAGLWALRGRAAPWPAGAFGLTLAGLLAAPALWSATPLWAGGDAALPYAGPALITRTNPAGAAPRPNSEATAARNLRLIEYLTANRGDARYLAATLNANTAAPLILATGQPVMALGGFSGNDPILTDTELAETIAAGAVRFFLLPVAPAAPGQTAGRGQAAGQGELRLWVNEHCAPVPAAAWQPAPGSSGALAAGPGGPLQLFDCAPGSR